MNICLFLIVCFVVIVEATMAKDVKIIKKGVARRSNHQRLKKSIRSNHCAPIFRRFDERFNGNEEGKEEAEEVDKEVDEDNVDEVKEIHEDEEDEAHDEEVEVEELGLEHDADPMKIEEEFMEEEKLEDQVNEVFVVAEEEYGEDPEFLDVDSSFVDDLDGGSYSDLWSTDSSESDSDSDESEDDNLSFRNEESEHEDEDMHQLKVVMQIDGTLVNVLNGWYLKNRIINIVDTLGAPLWQPPIEAENLISDTPLNLGK